MLMPKFGKNNDTNPRLKLIIENDITQVAQEVDCDYIKLYKDMFGHCRVEHDCNFKG